MAQTPGCICSATYIATLPLKTKLLHSATCIQANEKALDNELYAHIRWYRQDKPCSGVGMSHGPHGKCPGQTRDHT
jgi:hypothetical protein